MLESAALYPGHREVYIVVEGELIHMEGHGMAEVAQILVGIYQLFNISLKPDAKSSLKFLAKQLCGVDYYDDTTSTNAKLYEILNVLDSV